MTDQFKTRPDTEQTDKTPAFTHPELEALYRYGSDINRQILLNILELPRETLIADLEKVLTDCIARYNYFYDQDWDDDTHSFPVHALILLSVLHAEEAFPSFISILQQGEELLDYWFSDQVTEDFWQYAYALGQNKLDDFRKFILEPDRYVFAKTVLSDAVAQIAAHQPDRTKEAVAWLEDLIQGLADRKDDESVFDTMLFSILIGDLADIGGEEQVPLIERYYGLDMVSEFESGTLEDMLKDAVEPIQAYKIREIYTSLDQFYDDWLHWNSDQDYDRFDTPDNSRVQYGKPYVAPPKVGRNDPCPCGSGKKHKKCCGAN